MQTTTISGLAQTAGVNGKTIRFYQRRERARRAPRPLGGIRHYGEAEVARVLFIKAAQRIGFTLDEIAQLLQLDDGSRCSDTRVIAERKLTEVRQRLQDLQRIETALAQFVNRRASRGGTASCPLISAHHPDASFQEGSCRTRQAS